MTFFEQIQDDLKTSMKNRDADRTNTLRLLLAAMKNARVAGTQKEFTDEEDLALVKKQVKQRKESIAQFEAAGRDDLAEGEKKELVILEAYLPPEMDEAAIRAIVLEKKTALGVTDKWENSWVRLWERPMDRPMERW
jgi:uncharacterized protein YqeY